MRADERGAYRCAPRQERSRSTVDAIFEAASRLLGDAGLEGATTGKIAHLAGVSIGSLINTSPGKEALFGALTERAMHADLERVREAVDRARDMPLEEGSREVVRAAFAFALERPRLFCWMLRYLPALGLLPAVEQWERELMAETRRFLEDHRPELVGPDPELQAMAAVGAVRGALMMVARERPSFLEEEDERVVELATNLVLGLVRTPQERAGKT
jgi:AcrR family transcriptional regulator